MVIVCVNCDILFIMNFFNLLAVLVAHGDGSVMSLTCILKGRVLLILELNVVFVLSQLAI